MIGRRLALLALPALAGCAALAPAPFPAPRAVRGWPGWLEDWDQVLDRHVDDQGRVDFPGLQRSPEKLNAIVAEVAALGPANDPARFAEPGAALAYHLNAYNALCMHAILRIGAPRALPALGLYQFFFNTTIRVEGRADTLKEYEDRVIRPFGPRVHFALNCMAKGCPRLPRKAFRPATLEAELDAAAREFCNDPNQIRLDPARRRVEISEIFRFFTGDFVPGAAPTLTAYVNVWRREPIPAGWTQGFHRYDWRVNFQPGAAT